MQSVIERTPHRDIIIVPGDFNAKWEITTTREIIMGKEGLGNTNENGEMFTDFCEQNNLIVAGTVFPHRKIHKVTWILPIHRQRIN